MKTILDIVVFHQLYAVYYTTGNTRRDIYRGHCGRDRMVVGFICKQCISPLTLWVRISLVASCTRYNIMWSRFSMTCRKSMVYPDTPVSSINKTDHNDITAILLKVAVNTTALTNIVYIKTISASSNRFVFYCCIWLLIFVRSLFGLPRLPSWVIQHDGYRTRCRIRWLNYIFSFSLYPDFIFLLFTLILT